MSSQCGKDVIQAGGTAINVSLINSEISGATIKDSHLYDCTSTNTKLDGTTSISGDIMLSQSIIDALKKYLNPCGDDCETLDLVNCDGADIVSGTAVATCSDLSKAVSQLRTEIAALRTEVVTVHSINTLKSCEGSTIVAGNEVTLCAALPTNYTVEQRYVGEADANKILAPTRTNTHSNSNIVVISPIDIPGHVIKHAIVDGVVSASTQIEFPVGNVPSHTITYVYSLIAKIDISHVSDSSGREVAPAMIVLAGVQKILPVAVSGYTVSSYRIDGGELSAVPVDGVSISDVLSHSITFVYTAIATATYDTSFVCSEARRVIVGTSVVIAGNKSCQPATPTTEAALIELLTIRVANLGTGAFDVSDLKVVSDSGFLASAGAGGNWYTCMGDWPITVSTMDGSVSDTFMLAVSTDYTSSNGRFSLTEETIPYSGIAAMPSVPWWEVSPISPYGLGITDTTKPFGTCDTGLVPEVSPELYTIDTRYVVGSNEVNYIVTKGNVTVVGDATVHVVNAVSVCFAISTP